MILSSKEEYILLMKIDDDRDYKLAVETSSELKLMVKDIEKFNAKFDINENSEIKSELALAAGHLYKSLKHINDVADEIYDIKWEEHMLDEHILTDKEISEMQNKDN
jgi:hypothetical protein